MQGARIEKARKRTGLSQERFAPVVGTTRRHMIRLENGEHRPSGELLARIAEQTGQPAESFGYPSDEDEEAASYMDMALLGEIRALRAELAAMRDERVTA